MVGFEIGNRKITAHIREVIGTTDLIDHSLIKTVKIIDSGVSGDVYTVGGCCSQECKIKLIGIDSATRTLMLTKLVNRNAFFLYFESDYIDYNQTPQTASRNMGRFYINKLDWNQQNDGKWNAELLAYDILGLTDIAFSHSRTYSTSETFKDVADDIITCMGGDSVGIINEFPTEQTLNPTRIPKNCTCRQLLSYMASYMGKIVRASCSNMGVSYLQMYDFNFDISMHYMGLVTKEMYKQGGLKIEGNPCTLEYFQTGSSQYPVYSSSVEDITSQNTLVFENPLIRNYDETTLFRQKFSFPMTYTPMTLQCYGDPELRPGDVIQVDDINNNRLRFWVMKKEISFDGSYQETYYSYASEQSLLNTVDDSNKQYSSLNDRVSALESGSGSFVTQDMLLSFRNYSYMNVSQPNTFGYVVELCYCAYRGFDTTLNKDKYECYMDIYLPFALAPSYSTGYSHPVRCFKGFYSFGGYSTSNVMIEPYFENASDFNTWDDDAVPDIVCTSISNFTFKGEKTILIGYQNHTAASGGKNNACKNHIRLSFYAYK